MAVGFRIVCWCIAQGDGEQPRCHTGQTSHIPSIWLARLPRGWAPGGRRSVVTMTRRATPHCLFLETKPTEQLASHVEDEAYLGPRRGRGYHHLVERRGLHHRPDAVTARVQGLAVKPAMHEPRPERRHLHTRRSEALDLVHVQTLVDPRDEQVLQRFALGTDVSGLTLLDAFRRDGQRQRAEGGPGE